jgi:hypothetical protein
VANHSEQSQAQSFVPQQGKIVFFLVTGLLFFGQRLAGARSSEVPCD